MMLQDILVGWRELKPKRQFAFAALAAAVGFAAVLMTIPPDLLGPAMFVGAAAASVLLGRRNKTAYHATTETQERELAKRRALIAKYGYVPLTDLAASGTPFVDLGQPTPVPLVAEELKRARRADWVRRYGHVPLAELADPLHPDVPPLPPSPAAPPPGPALRTEVGVEPLSPPAPVTRSGQADPSAASPIVEAGRHPWRRRRSTPGSIVE